ncbi:MAG: hypothetical protein AAF085_00810 [Planctomycetota bacterium]
MTSTTYPTLTTQYTNGIDQRSDFQTPLDQLVAYSLIHSGHRLHFDHPVTYLNTAILVMLLRLPAKQPAGDHPAAHRSPNLDRVALVGLKASFNPDDRITTWGPDPLFWIELPPAMMAQPTGRSSPVNDPQLGHLALALNRAAHRESQRGLPLPGGPLMPPTMIALPPEVCEPKVIVNNYVQRMAEIFRVSIDEVWPILADEMIIPAEASHVGAPLIDARIWDPSHGERLGEYAFLGGSLGRAVFNPARKIVNIDFMEQDHVIQVMRRSLAMDLAVGCTNQDLRDAADSPTYPLFLSKVPKIGVFRLDRGDTDNNVIELAGQGQRVLLPTDRPASTPTRRRGSIPCTPMSTTI